MLTHPDAIKQIQDKTTTGCLVAVIWLYSLQRVPGRLQVADDLNISRVRGSSELHLENSFIAHMSKLKLGKDVGPNH